MSRRLSASSFRSLVHCPHALFLDHHGNANLKTELGEFEQYLLDDGKRFEQEILAGKEYVQPEYPEGDLDAGAEVTLQLTKAGAPLIYQGVLKADRFVGIPDLLVKKPGKSNMLDGFYEPIEIKIAKSIKPFHILQVCFYALLLEQIQGFRPETATVILADKSEEAVNLYEVWTEFERQLARAISVVDRTVPTNLAISSGCGECAWQDVCAAEARDRKDVTLVADLRRAAKPALVQAGIVTIDELANGDPEQLRQIRGIGEKSAERLPLQARCQVSGKAVTVGRPTLPESDVELYYDIESEPNLDIDYLHGLLVVVPDKKPEYVAFLADRPEDEGDSFGRFVCKVAEILERHPLAPIYHFHLYERTRVAKLFDRYPDQPVTKDALMDRFIDLHRVVKDAFVLPVEGYGLKPVSKWLGFCYRRSRSAGMRRSSGSRVGPDGTTNSDAARRRQDLCQNCGEPESWASPPENQNQGFAPEENQSQTPSPPESRAFQPPPTASNTETRSRAQRKACCGISFGSTQGIGNTWMTACCITKTTARRPG